MLFSARMHKTYFYIIAALLPLVAVWAKLVARLKLEVPVGYQDESGFHIGHNQVDSKINWPPFW